LTFSLLVVLVLHSPGLDTSEFIANVGKWCLIDSDSRLGIQVKFKHFAVKTPMRIGLGARKQCPFAAFDISVRLVDITCTF
jgi:hypothetical protein